MILDLKREFYKNILKIFTTKKFCVGIFFVFLMLNLSSCYMWVKIEDLDKSKETQSGSGGDSGNNAGPSQKTWNINLQINNGSEYTNKINNTLAIDVPTAIEMSINSNMANCLTSTTWSPYSVSEPVVISQINQVNQVCLKFRDLNMITSDCVCKNITHDALSPLPPQKIKLDMSISSTTPYLNFNSISDRGLSGILKYQYKVIEYTTEYIYKDWTEVSITEGSISRANLDLSSITGGTSYQLIFRTIDAAGNPSPPVSSEVWGDKIIFQPLKAVTYYPYKFLAHDFDLDGEVDASVFDTDGYYLFWHKNRVSSDGIFSEPQKLVDFKIEQNNFYFYQYYNYTFNHLNNDSAIDLVTWSVQQNKNIFKFYKNEMPTIGQFTEISGITLESNKNSYFDFYDLTGDGKDDFIVAEGTQIFWQKNLINEMTDDTFLSSQLFVSVNLPITQFKIIDLNKDSQLDLLVQVGTAQQWIYKENLGNFQFNAANVIITNATGQLTEAQDIDGDGLLDLITIGGWYKNSGDNLNFSTFNSFGYTVHYYSINAQFFNDFDKDGDLDLVAAPEDFDDSIRFYKNNGNGSFTETQTIFTLSFGHELFGMQFNDLDHDGDLDLMFYQSDPSRAYFIYYDQGTNLFSSTVNSLTLRHNDMAADKINNDSLNDIVLATNSGIFLYLNDPQFPGTLGKGIRVTSNNTSFVGLGDLNSDGLVDVVGAYSDLTNTGQSKIIWYKNIGNNQFITGATLASGFNSIIGFKVVDFENNSLPDIVYASNSSSLIAWIKNQGNESFASSATITSSYNTINNIDTGDFDKDGDQDLVFSTMGGARWLRFDHSSQTFSGVVQTMSGCYQKVRVGDIDDDGDPDLGCRWGEYIYFNNSGTFSVGIDYNPLGTSVIDLSFIDFDQDQKTDILVIHDYNYFYVFKNQGGGTFAPRELIYTVIKDCENFKILNLDDDPEPEAIVIDNNKNIDVLNFKK